jgi:hypothetical protein
MPFGESPWYQYLNPFYWNWGIGQEADYSSFIDHLIEAKAKSHYNPFKTLKSDGEPLWS